MFKKISKFLFTTAMCTALMAGTVCAGKAYYNFTLGNTGTSIQTFSSSNNKTILSNPWTLKVTYMNCSGMYGIRFAPAIINSSTGAVARVCTKSGVWRSGTGYGTTAYASGDAVLATYKLGARQDDSYQFQFQSSGWWNADKLSNQ